MSQRSLASGWLFLKMEGCEYRCELCTTKTLVICGCYSNHSVLIMLSITSPNITLFLPMFKCHHFTYNGCLHRFRPSETLDVYIVPMFIAIIDELIVL
jgi:hypothetical protein